MIPFIVAEKVDSAIKMNMFRPRKPYIIIIQMNKKYPTPTIGNKHIHNEPLRYGMRIWRKMPHSPWPGTRINDFLIEVNHFIFFNSFFFLSIYLNSNNDDDNNDCMSATNYSYTNDKDSLFQFIYLLPAH